jgi:hypothetical protein
MMNNQIVHNESRSEFPIHFFIRDSILTKKREAKKVVSSVQ